MGITPYDNQSSFALMHRYRIFSDYQAVGQPAHFFPAGARPLFPAPLNGDNGYEHEHHGSPTDFEAFRVVELRGKYFLSQRVEFNAFLPYVMNTSQVSGKQLNSSGVGDATVFAGYHLIRVIETAGVQTRLVVGGGVTLPTDAFRRQNDQGERYPLLNQVGTDTTDGFLYANYIGSYHSFGLSVNSSYRRATENAFRNSLAPSTATFASLFYRLPSVPAGRCIRRSSSSTRKPTVKCSTASSPASTPSTTPCSGPPPKRRRPRMPKKRSLTANSDPHNTKAGRLPRGRRRYTVSQISQPVLPRRGPRHNKKASSTMLEAFFVATVGIEPTTPAFSVLCSTN